MTKLEVTPTASPPEDKFWNTPVATARTLRFTDNLMDEEMEVGDISEISLKNPSASTSQSSSPRLNIDEYSVNALDHASDGSLPAACENNVPLDNSKISHHSEEDEVNQQHRHDRFDSETDNPAVGTTSQPFSAATLNEELVSPVLDPSLNSTLGSKIRVNNVVERIVVSLTD